ncbi:UNKNOWN [Stylonychia lemnae]|uniref:Uncharacterized protein n=1 Tax=Stylonychia lemnae TaxID=5949 RepID=A0A077ZVE6_STYLE|nr:UNKNOWN [Stylonychia lemnae]|eukprot:CDW72396.1 UNKNOWN [Stylonychia lemnae]
MTKNYCGQCVDSDNIDHNPNQGKYICRHGKDWYQYEEDQRQNKKAENECRTIEKIRERMKDERKKDKIRIQRIRDEHRAQKERENREKEARQNELKTQAEHNIREFLLQHPQCASVDINTEVLPQAVLVGIAAGVGKEIAAILIANPQVLLGAVLFTGIVVGFGFFLNWLNGILPPKKQSDGVPVWLQHQIP